MADQAQSQAQNQRQNPTPTQTQPQSTGTPFHPAGHTLAHPPQPQDQNQSQTETNATQDPWSAQIEATQAAAAKVEAEWFISENMTCGRCQQNKVIYSQVQTRPADEPMTTFCGCTFCGMKWKYS